MAYAVTGLLCLVAALTLVGLRRDRGVSIPSFAFWFALAYNAWA